MLLFSTPISAVLPSLYDFADSDHDGKIGTQDATVLLKKSGLETAVLAQVWTAGVTSDTISERKDQDGLTALTKLLSLVALAQKSAADSTDFQTLLRSGTPVLLDPPAFDGFTYPSLDELWMVDQRHLGMFRSFFLTSGGSGKEISEENTFKVFSQSGLSREVTEPLRRLLHIESTAESKKYTDKEFILGMHLVRLRVNATAFPDSIDRIPKSLLTAIGFDAKQKLSIPNVNKSASVETGTKKRNYNLDFMKDMDTIGIDPYSKSKVKEVSSPEVTSASNFDFSNDAFFSKTDFSVSGTSADPFFSDSEGSRDNTTLQNSAQTTDLTQESFFTGTQVTPSGIASNSAEFGSAFQAGSSLQEQSMFADPFFLNQSESQKSQTAITPASRINDSKDQNSDLFHGNSSSTATSFVLDGDGSDSKQSPVQFTGFFAQDGISVAQQLDAHQSVPADNQIANSSVPLKDALFSDSGSLPVTTPVKKDSTLLFSETLSDKLSNSHKEHSIFATSEMGHESSVSDDSKDMFKTNTFGDEPKSNLEFGLHQQGKDVFDSLTINTEEHAEKKQFSLRPEVELFDSKTVSEHSAGNHRENTYSVDNNSIDSEKKDALSGGDVNVSKQNVEQLSESVTNESVKAKEDNQSEHEKVSDYKTPFDDETEENIDSGCAVVEGDKTVLQMEPSVSVEESPTNERAVQNGDLSSIPNVLDVSLTQEITPLSTNAVELSKGADDTSKFNDTGSSTQLNCSLNELSHGTTKKDVLLFDSDDEQLDSEKHFADKDAPLFHAGHASAGHAAEQKQGGSQAVSTEESKKYPEAIVNEDSFFSSSTDNNSFMFNDSSSARLSDTAKTGSGVKHFSDDFFFVSDSAKTSDSPSGDHGVQSTESSFQKASEATFSENASNSFFSATKNESQNNKNIAQLPELSVHDNSQASTKNADSNINSSQTGSASILMPETHQVDTFSFDPVFDSPKQAEISEATQNIETGKNGFPQNMPSSVDKSTEGEICEKPLDNQHITEQSKNDPSQNKTSKKSTNVSVDLENKKSLKASSSSSSISLPGVNPVTAAKIKMLNLDIEQTSRFKDQAEHVLKEEESALAKANEDLVLLQQKYETLRVEVKTLETKARVLRTENKKKKSFITSIGKELDILLAQANKVAEMLAKANVTVSHGPSHAQKELDKNTVIRQEKSNNVNVPKEQPVKKESNPSQHTKNDQVINSTIINEENKQIKQQQQQQQQQQLKDSIEPSKNIHIHKEGKILEWDAKGLVFGKDFDPSVGWDGINPRKEPTRNPYLYSSLKDDIEKANRIFGPVLSSFLCYKTALRRQQKPTPAKTENNTEIVSVSKTVPSETIASASSRQETGTTNAPSSSDEKELVHEEVTPFSSNDNFFNAPGAFGSENFGKPDNFFDASDDFFNNAEFSFKQDTTEDNQKFGVAGGQSFDWITTNSDESSLKESIVDSTGASSSLSKEVSGESPVVPDTKDPLHNCTSDEGDHNESDAQKSGSSVATLLDKSDNFDGVSFSEDDKTEDLTSDAKNVSTTSENAREPAAKVVRQPSADSQTNESHSESLSATPDDQTLHQAFSKDESAQSSSLSSDTTLSATFSEQVSQSNHLEIQSHALEGKTIEGAEDETISDNSNNSLLPNQIEHQKTNDVHNISTNEDHSTKVNDEHVSTENKDGGLNNFVKPAGVSETDTFNDVSAGTAKDLPLSKQLKEQSSEASSDVDIREHSTNGNVVEANKSLDAQSKERESENDIEMSSTESKPFKTAQDDHPLSKDDEAQMITTVEHKNSNSLNPNDSRDDLFTANSTQPNTDINNKITDDESIPSNTIESTDGQLENSDISAPLADKQPPEIQGNEDKNKDTASEFHGEMPSGESENLFEENISSDVAEQTDESLSDTVNPTIEKREVSDFDTTNSTANFFGNDSFFGSDTFAENNSSQSFAQKEDLFANDNFFQ